MQTKIQKRAGGEKRGSKYDRQARYSRLSMADGSAPIVSVAAQGRRRLKGAWMPEAITLPFRTENLCAHCGDLTAFPLERVESVTLKDHRQPTGTITLHNVLTIDVDARQTRSAYNAECDRIDPNKGYTADNVQILCGPCNEAKSDRYIG